MKRINMATAALLFLAACSGSDAAQDAAFVIDTLPNGAVRVVNTPPADERPAVFEEELRIGSVDSSGATNFGQIKGIAVLQDGRIVVLDALASELRVFAADGKHLATYGGKGAGPGEMEGPYGLMHASDGTLWVPDHTNERMSVYNADTGFVTSWPFTVLSYGWIWSGAMDSQGRILERSISLGPPRRNVIRVYARTGDAFGAVDSMFLPDDPAVDPKNPPGAWYWEAPGGGMRGYTGIPFASRGAQVLDARGGIWAAAADGYRFAYLQPAGDTTLVVESKRQPVAVRTGERDSAIATITESFRKYGAPAPDFSRIPTAKPSIISLFRTADDHIWVERPADNSDNAYDIFTLDGHYQSTVSPGFKFAAGLTPVVRDGRVWAVVEDADQVQYIIRAKISQPGAARD